MSGRWARYERALFGIGVDLRQGAGQGVGIAGPVGSGLVGSVFAGARDAELDHMAANGARKIMAMAALPPPPPRSLRLPRMPPKIMPHLAIEASQVMAPAKVAAMELMRMSRFRTWPSSWASTPSSSSSLSSPRMPWVTATDAWFGLRPVAKALGESDRMR